MQIYLMICIKGCRRNNGKKTRNLCSQSFGIIKKVFPFLYKAIYQGLYSSTVKANIIDEDNTDKEALFRQKFNVDDNNMFVTNFVLMNLLETQSFGKIQLDIESFLEALDAILQFKDKNFEEDLPIFNFWPQKLINDTWSAEPENLFNLVDMLPNMPPYVKKQFEEHGLGFFTYAKLFTTVFRIPADNDDSSVNIALACLLRKNKEKYPQLYARWNSKNFNYKKYYENAVYFAYRPYLKPTDPFPQHHNEIDSRTYYALHQFIEQHDNLILVSTWLLDDDTRVAGLYDYPFQINNVDLSVNANFIFGLTHFLLTLDQVELNEFFQGDIRQMYRDVTNLLVWAVETRLPETRPDIALVYYPSQFDFYWFLTRIVTLIEQQIDELPVEEMELLRRRLRKALEQQGTDFILKKAQCDEKNCYWDEFLGDYKGKMRGEDRIFSTSLALNVLLDIWTYQDGNQLKWRQQTPEQIKLIADKASSFIVHNYADNKLLRNAFFSGSVKGQTTYSYFYPMNIHDDRNGTQYDPQTQDVSQTSDLTSRFGVKGVLQNYDELVQKKWFKEGNKYVYQISQIDVPTEFKGFNTEYGFGFPFWSSDAISYSVSLLALSKYDALI